MMDFRLITSKGIKNFLCNDIDFIIVKRGILKRNKYYELIMRTVNTEHYWNFKKKESAEKLNKFLLDKLSTLNDAPKNCYYDVDIRNFETEVYKEDNV